MLTAAIIQDELARAFSGNHGAGCSCCEPFAGGRPPLEAELLREARYALARFDGDSGRDRAPTDDELEELAQAAASDALAAARTAITARAVQGLATAPPQRPAPVVVPLDPATHRISCRASTFDGTFTRQCTRPASFTRDGLEVCRQHAVLAMIRAAHTVSAD